MSGPELRRRAQLFQRSHALVAHLPSPLGALHSWTWLHALDEADLNALTMDSYKGERGEAFANQDHNFQGLWPWEEAAVRDCFGEDDSILVAGCGGGRELIALARAGHEVGGFDASEDLVSVCMENLRKAGLTAVVDHAPPGEVPSMPVAYDALFVGRGVYHHIPRRGNRIRFLAACRRALRPGGLAYLGDFLARDDGSHRLTGLSPSRKVERGDVVSACYYHYFAPDEIRDELASAGFDLVDFRPTPFPGAEGATAHAIARSRS